MKKVEVQNQQSDDDLPIRKTKKEHHAFQRESPLKSASL